MRIIVDADSINARVREIIAAAADRRGLKALFVANRPLRLPEGSRAKLLIATDVDERMTALAARDDVAVTRDIPLAARLVERGVPVLNDRGDRFDERNMAERLRRRDAAKRLRDAGLLWENPRSFGPKHVKAFADALDRELTRLGVPTGRGPAAAAREDRDEPPVVPSEANR